MIYDTIQNVANISLSNTEKKINQTNFLINAYNKTLELQKIYVRAQSKMLDTLSVIYTFVHRFKIR